MKVVATLVLSCLGAFSLNANASAIPKELSKPSNMGMAASAGYGEEDVKPYRLAALWDLGPVALKRGSWQAHLYWEASAALMDGEYQGTRELTTDEMHVLTTGPQLRFMRNAPWAERLYPYVEFGISASWFSERKLADKTFDTSFQFEDRIGFGARFGKKMEYDVNCRVIHYSNAGLGSNNDGLNVMMVTVGRWF